MIQAYKMSGIFGGSPKRYRGGAAGGGRMRGAFSRWARGVLRARRGGRVARRIGGTYAAALARVHSFKRVGLEMQMANTGANTLPSLNNAAGSGAFPYLQVGSLSNANCMPDTSQFGGAFTFQLAQLALPAGTGLTDITNLFDNYRISRVELRFDLSYNAAPGGPGIAGLRGITSLPVMHICPDYDDNAIPASREQVLENAYCRTIRLEKSFTMSIKPRAQTVVATGASTSATGVGGLLPTGTWLDTSAPQVPHFGVKFWMEDFPTPSTGAQPNAQVRITPTYYLECKNVI